MLLDDARSLGGSASLFRAPVRIVETADPDAVETCLEELREATNSGLHAAGFLSYEAGHSLDRKLRPLRMKVSDAAVPLLWFGMFETREELLAGAVATLLPDASRAWATPPCPLVCQTDYEVVVARIKAHIEAGDIYQANFTFQAEVAVSGSPLALYAAIRQRAAGGHGALVHTGRDWLLSFSPEMFFTLEAGKLTARPMKGTAKRGVDPQEDEALSAALRSDPKQRAENLMIVDLLRNDLSRVSRPGTVKVPELFEVETYPTVHQMTSTVTAELEAGLDVGNVIAATFPCGSITGAPKLRAMEIIHDVEERWRGAYTGSIGRWSPDGNAAFNVAIRTLWLRDGSNVARIGLGSGIVADSIPGDEWHECLAKGAFVAGGAAPFDLIETMRFDPHSGLVDLDRHLARMKRSADALGFTFNRHQARNELQAATFRLPEVRRVRLLLSQCGAISIETRPWQQPAAGSLTVRMAPLPVAASDFRLRHKTTDRAFYDEARRASGADELLFVDEEGRITEGSFTNVFVPRGGKLLTPPLSLGLLPGILRERLIESGEAEDAELRADDLQGTFYVGNSLRGLVPARLA